jgi:hypothetical protein
MRLLIHVAGGNIQQIIAHGKIEIDVYDEDNLQAGDYEQPAAYPVDCVEGAEYDRIRDEFVQEAREYVRRHPPGWTVALPTLRSQG